MMMYMSPEAWTWAGPMSAVLVDVRTSAIQSGWPAKSALEALTSPPNPDPAFLLRVSC